MLASHCHSSGWTACGFAADSHPMRLSRIGCELRRVVDSEVQRARPGGGETALDRRHRTAAAGGTGLLRDAGGFANRQLARNLARSTVEGRENTVKAFTAYVNAFPWQWTPAMVDEWLGDLRSLRDLKRSTIRSYSEAIRSFCHFATGPLYEWATTCEERFGSPPVQIVHEWNTAAHVQDNESDAQKRAFTKAELHAFFAH